MFKWEMPNLDDLPKMDCARSKFVYLCESLEQYTISPEQTSRRESKTLTQAFCEKVETYRINVQKWASQYHKLGFLEAQLAEHKEEAQDFEDRVSW